MIHVSIILFIKKAVEGKEGEKKKESIREEKVGRGEGGVSGSSRRVRSRSHHCLQKDLN